MKDKTKHESDAAPVSEQHTPGPWQYSGSINGPDISIHQIFDDPSKETIAINGGPGFIARVSTNRKSGLEAIGSKYESNARLIAAAPELLEALKGLVECPDYRGISTHEMSIARAAIARAEGRVS